MRLIPALSVLLLAGCAASASEPEQLECASFAINTRGLTQKEAANLAEGQLTRLPAGWTPIGGSVADMGLPMVFACRPVRGVVPTAP